MTDTPRGIMVDPPSGWRYGFPKLKEDTDTRTTEQWLIDEGYPKDQAKFASENCRWWMH